MATGWTGGLIAPDQRIHDAAHAAIDSTGGSASQTLRTAVTQASSPPATIQVPAYASTPGQVLSGSIPMITIPNPALAQAAPQTAAPPLLNDARLGSRSVGGATSAPLGAPVGSASVYQNSGIPGTIQAAIGNLNTNTQNQTLASILGQVLHGIGGGNSPSPAQDALFRAQTEQINQNMNTASGPTNVQAQIDALNQKQATAAAVNPLANRSAPIGVRPTAQNNLDWSLQQQLNGSLSNSINAQSNGWISQPYADPALSANAIRNQQSGVWDAGRVVY